MKSGVESESDSLSITDSGIGTPQTLKLLVQKYLEASKKKLPMEVHSHNDFGLALANTLARYGAWASVAYCCVAREENIT